MTMDRSGIFAGDDPFSIAQTWLTEAEGQEPNDPNAIALATVDADGNTVPTGSSSGYGFGLMHSF